MAINTTAIWRIRPSGSDTNGGGYDPAISGVLSTTLASGITSSQTTIGIASASGWPSSGNYYARIGNTGPEASGNGTAGSSEVVLVTGGQGTTTWTVTRAQLGTTGLAQLSGTVVDNSLNQCNSPIFSGTLGASTASTTFTDASGAFNSTMVGNTLFLASATGTPTANTMYFITAVGSATSMTLDRVSGTYTAGVYTIGGGWQNIQVNCANLTTAPKGGNIIYIRGSGSLTPNPASPDYVHNAAAGNQSSGSTSLGFVKYVGECGIPIMTAGTFNGVFYAGPENSIDNVYFAGTATSANPLVKASGLTRLTNVKLDQNGFDCVLLGGGGNLRLHNVEMLNSGTVPGSTNPAYTVTSGGGLYMDTCNVHDTNGVGIALGNVSESGFTAVNTIFAKCGGDSITVQFTPSVGPGLVVKNCTFDGGGNSINGISFNSFVDTMIGVDLFNNIFANFSTSGKAAINNTAGTAAQADANKGLVDYNAFYNNNANYTNMSAGAHDIALAASPFVNESTEDYRLTTSALVGVGYLAVPYPQSKSGQATGVQSYVTIGAITPQPVTGAFSLESPVKGPGGGAVGY